MMKQLFSAAVVACLALAAAAPADDITVILLGTGVGPPVNLQQFGASTLVEAGGERFLFDCGRGATIRLAQAGIPIGSTRERVSVFPNAALFASGRGENSASARAEGGISGWTNR